MNALITLCLCALAANIAGTFAQRSEDKDCPGPLKFYREIGCNPVYDSSDDKCAAKFECKSIDNRSPDKCYFGGKETNVGEGLSDEDRAPCDHCTCAKRGNHAGFVCAIVDCYHPNPRPGCYQQRNATQCCPGFTLICPNDPRDIPTCEVDGKVYKDGEYFQPSSEPNKRCFCGPGYKGQNIAPFCISKARVECRTELRYSREVAGRCAPVYEADQSPQTSCTTKFRCQTPNDRVLRIDGPKPEGVSCKFGDLSMNYGDELSIGDDANAKCVKCRCEVSPTPTCQRLPRDKCQ
ncbi:uncharacterized protein LOC135165078 [Diachasmimorpha longicaudata]|uniref:uncharacterized protein LOC135165078 n=1 Tax=Diachasmimorpha longicaudata TaxID=58733 RepID=UPI0030B8F4E8